MNKYVKLFVVTVMITHMAYLFCYHDINIKHMNAKNVSLLSDFEARRRKSIIFTTESPYTSSVSPSSSPTSEPFQIEKSREMRSVPKVLVVSQGRSGSSFLGSLLSAGHNAFYFYEPFKGMVPDGKNFVDKSDAAKSFVVENIINNLFNCTLTLEERTKLQTRKV